MKVFLIVLLTLACTPASSQADTTGGISGLIYYWFDNTPARDVQVRVSSGYAVMSVVTDKNGRFTVLDIPPGKVDIHFHAPGMIDGTITECLSAGEVKDVRIPVTHGGGSSGFFATAMYRNWQRTGMQRVDANQTSDVYTVGAC